MFFLDKEIEMKFSGGCIILFRERGKTDIQLTNPSFKEPSAKTDVSILQLAESFKSGNSKPLATFRELMGILPGDFTFNNTSYPANLVAHLTCFPKESLGILMYPLDQLSIKNSICFWNNLPRVSVLSNEVNITSEGVYWYMVFEDRRRKQKGRCVLEIHTAESPASTLADFKYRWGCS